MGEAECDGASAGSLPLPLSSRSWLVRRSDERSSRAQQRLHPHSGR